MNRAVLPLSVSLNIPSIFKYIVFPGEFTDLGGLIFHLFLGRVNHVPKAKPLSKGEQTVSDTVESNKSIMVCTCEPFTLEGNFYP